MVIGTASLILVVTIGLTGKQYVLNQIQGIGANEILAEYQGGSPRITATVPDLLTLDDLYAVQQEVPGIVASSPVVPLNDRVAVGSGKERDILVLGVFPEYLKVRSLVVLSGRFFDAEDEQARNKVGVIAEKFAEKVYGSHGQRRRQGHQAEWPALHHHRNFQGTRGYLRPIRDHRRHHVDPLHREPVFHRHSERQADLLLHGRSCPWWCRGPNRCGASSRAVTGPESVYNISNLTELLAVADKSANALTMVLLLIATVTLLVSGIGIMNIMLATVSSRIREIGIRKAIGASSREIRFQFLSEAVLISLAGGFVGVVIGLALPFSVRFLTQYRIPISGLSAIVAIVVSSLVGILFGTVPAARAAKLDPVESLRYE